MIISIRQVKAPHEVVTSGQLCSVKGKDIYNSTHNLLCSIIDYEERLKFARDLSYEEKDVGGGVIISYDLMKAFNSLHSILDQGGGHGVLIQVLGLGQDDARGGRHKVYVP